MHVDVYSCSVPGIGVNWCITVYYMPSLSHAQITTVGIAPIGRVQAIRLSPAVAIRAQVEISNSRCHFYYRN